MWHTLEFKSHSTSHYIWKRQTHETRLALAWDCRCLVCCSKYADYNVYSLDWAIHSCCKCVCERQRLRGKQDRQYTCVCWEMVQTDRKKKKEREIREGEMASMDPSVARLGLFLEMGRWLGRACCPWGGWEREREKEVRVRRHAAPAWVAWLALWVSACIPWSLFLK